MGGEDREEGRTERGRAGATHIETCFHEGVDDRLYLRGWVVSTEPPQSLQFWGAFIGLPHTRQVSPSAFDHALRHL